ncbi:hypothetical protein [Brevundimonas sp.]
MTDPNPDSALTTLNASERELLLLLGRGHTAKSIAALKDLTELAVNERFRSARRKTGIGSSREIARLLVAQENRDDIIGVAEAAPPVAPLPRPDASRRASPLRRWSLPMSAAVLLIAAAILAQQTATPSTTTARTMPTPAGADAVFAPRTDPADAAALRREIADGAVDPDWSPQMEAALSRAYHLKTDHTGAVASVDVTCGATLCEVLGVAKPNLSTAQVDIVIEAFQGHDVHAFGAEMSLSNVMTGITTATNPQALVFVAYWRRAD